MIHTYGLARLGRDSELRYTDKGDAVCNLSLAFSYGKRMENGNRPTTWIDASLWGRRAEGLAPYLRKGTTVMVAVEDLHIEYFKNREGHETPKLVGRVTDIELGEVAPREEEPREGAAPAAQAPRRPMPAATRVAPPPRAPAAPAGGGSGFDDFDDDVPY